MGASLGSAVHLIQKHQFFVSANSSSAKRSTTKTRALHTPVNCNLYRVLELVDHRVTSTAIKSAYRRLARKYHPDVNTDPQATERFRAVTAAYEVLGDEQRRRDYDASTFGQEAVPRRPPASPVTGSDITIRVDITFNDAIFGTERIVDVHAMGTCQSCNGTKAQRGRPALKCALCAGHGEIIKTVDIDDGRQSMRIGCPACGGHGFHVTEYCRTCDGTGLTQQAKQVKVAIPAGVDAASVLKVAGQGDQGRDGGQHGDLWVRLQIGEHQGIDRQGPDLYSDINIPIWDAMLGSTVLVPTIYGNTRDLNIPPGSEHGSVVSLAGEGAVNLQDRGRIKTKGAHYYNVKVWVPTAVSAEEEVLLRKLAELQKQKSKRQGKGKGNIS